MKCKVTFQPSGKSIIVHSGTTVLEASKKANLSIRSRCGGQAACLMCKIKVTHNSIVSSYSDKEKRKMGWEDSQRTSEDKETEIERLACQTKIFGNTQVTIPQDPLKSVVQNLLQKQKEEEDLW